MQLVCLYGNMANHATLDSTPAGFYQIVDCLTRTNRTTSVQTWSPPPRLYSITLLINTGTQEVKSVFNRKIAAFRSRDREAMTAAQQEVK